MQHTPWTDLYLWIFFLILLPLCIGLDHTLFVRLINFLVGGGVQYFHPSPLWKWRSLLTIAIFLSAGNQALFSSRRMKMFELISFMDLTITDMTSRPSLKPDPSLFELRFDWWQPLLTSNFQIMLSEPHYQVYLLLSLALYNLKIGAIARAHLVLVSWVFLSWIPFCIALRFLYYV